MKIMTYVPRDNHGRFAIKFPWVRFLFVLSWFGLLFLSLQGLKWHYVWSCDVNSKVSNAVVVKGHLMTKESCNEIADAFAEQAFPTVSTNYTAANADILK